MLSLAHVRAHTHIIPSPWTLPTEFDNVCNNMHGFSHIKIWGLTRFYVTSYPQKKTPHRIREVIHETQIFLMNEE
jgi:hypothetical protein